MSDKVVFHVSLTRDAVTAFHRIMAKAKLAKGTVLRIAVEDLFGLTRYRLFLDDVIDLVEDVLCHSREVPVVTKKKDAEFLSGSVIDFNWSGPKGAAFTIDNPNARTKASDPGHIRMSRRRLKALAPELSGDEVGRTEDHLMRGDSRAAVVVSVRPLLVAAYTDELDCVAILRFPSDLADEYGLREGSRLLTVNLYQQGRKVAADLTPGPRDAGRYANFGPLIADFLTDDVDRVKKRKREISEEEWERTERMGQKYLDRYGTRDVRSGIPGHCWDPAS